MVPSGTGGDRPIGGGESFSSSVCLLLNRSIRLKKKTPEYSTIPGDILGFTTRAYDS